MPYNLKNAVNRHLGLIYKLQEEGKTLKEISNHLRTVSLCISSSALSKILANLRGKPRNPITPHLETIYALKRSGLTFEMIADRMKEEYGLEAPADSLRRALRYANRKLIPEVASMVYGTPDVEETPPFEPYLAGLGSRNKKKGGLVKTKKVPR